MSTIDSPSVIRTILLHNGCYPGDPQLDSVWSYINDWEQQTYKVIRSSKEELAFLLSPFIHNPHLLWDREGGLTLLGQSFLDSTKEIPNA